MIEAPLIPQDATEYVHKRLIEANPERSIAFVVIVVEDGAPPRMEGTIRPDEANLLFQFLLDHSEDAVVEARSVDSTVS